MKTIDVTMEDIKNGIPASGCNCPIALALRREFNVPPENVDVEGSAHILVDGMNMVVIGMYKQKVDDFIANFDDMNKSRIIYDPIYPFSFTIETGDNYDDY